MMCSGRADLSVCDSLENGVILLYNRIRTKANSEFDILLEETDIDGILKDGESTYAPSVVSLVEKLSGETMGGKKNREWFSIKFKENDPAHDAVIRLLEKQGPHSKAQFLVNAVLHYINCLETPDIAVPQTIDRAAIEEIVAEILSRKEMMEQTSHEPDVRNGYVTERRAVKAERKMDGEPPQTEMDQVTLALIADTMSAFRSN